MDRHELNKMFDGLTPTPARERELLRQILQDDARRNKPMKNWKRVVVAVAACLALVGTAFAASPGLREMLSTALGSFAPYAQEQEDKTYTIDGLEFKVLSVLADDYTIRAYVEAKDVKGDIFSKIDDITIPGRVSGGVNVSTVNEWLAPNAVESWASQAECLSYDAESKTALLVVSTWKTMPENLTSARVEVRFIDSYLTGEFETVWKNKRSVTIPVDVKPVESTVLGKDTALVSDLDAEEGHLSPLGLTLIFDNYKIHRDELEGYGTEAVSVSVKLVDGSIVEAPKGGQGGVFLPPYEKNSWRVITWNFREPVETENITGVYVGDEYFPVK